MNKDTWSASPLDHCLARVAQDKMRRVQGSTWWISLLIDWENCFFLANVIFLTPPYSEMHVGNNVSWQNSKLMHFPKSFLYNKLDCTNTSAHNFLLDVVHCPRKWWNNWVDQAISRVTLHFDWIVLHCSCGGEERKALLVIPPNVPCPPPLSDSGPVIAFLW